MSSRRKGTPYHAYVDESLRKTRYMMTAILVLPKDVEAITRAVRGVVLKGQRRTHFSAESAARRRQILACYMELDFRAIVAEATYAGGDDQLARNVCIGVLLKAFEARNVNYAVFDTREEVRDRKDRSHIESCLKRGMGPEGLQYVHKGSRTELMLGLPDAFAWSYGAGSDWLKAVEPKLLEAIGP